MLARGASVEELMRGCLHSAEFGGNYHRFLSAHLRPDRRTEEGHVQLETFTPSQLRWLSEFTTRLDEFLVVRYRTSPGTQPVIHVRGQSVFDHYPRLIQSVEYIQYVVSAHILNPDWFDLHFPGQFDPHSERVCVIQTGDCAESIAGTVGYSARSKKVKLIPDVHFWIERGYAALRRELEAAWVTWPHRTRSAFWRGSSTGGEPRTFDELRNLLRFRLCELSIAHPDLLDARLTSIPQARVSPESENMLARAEQLGVLSTPVPQTAFMRYKYLVDIDGNSNSWGFLIKLMMGACVLKVRSDWQQWYYKSLKPGVHFIPIQADLSDLADTITWCLHNDEAAEAIANNARRYASAMVFGMQMQNAAKMLVSASMPSKEGAGGSGGMPTLRYIQAGLSPTLGVAAVNRKSASLHLELPDILEFVGEFGPELVCFVPTVYWLFVCGLLGDTKVKTYAGMRCFYFFLSDSQVSFKSEQRHLIPAREQPACLANRHEHCATKKPTEMFPDYRGHFSQYKYPHEKPLLVVNNKYCDEWGVGPINFINLDLLDQIFTSLKDCFEILYFRQGIVTLDAGFSADHNAILPFNDLGVLRKHPEVKIFEEVISSYPSFDYNTLKNIIYSKCYHYITSQGGGSHHCAYYSGSLLAILHKRGEETGFAYAQGFYRYLSNPTPLCVICKTDEQLRQSLPIFRNAPVVGDRVVIPPELAATISPLLPAKIPDAAARLGELEARFLT